MMPSLRLTALVVAALAILASPAASALPAGPYVNSVSDTGAKIVWAEAAAESGITVELFDVTANAASAAKPTNERNAIAGETAEVIHTAAFTGLQAAHQYRYTLSRQGTKLAEGTFRTAPAPGTKAPVKFVTYGDPQTYPDRHRQVVEAVRKELPFDFLALSGDLADDASKWPDVRSEFFGVARELLTQTALWTTRGNHEGDGRVYADAFAQPGTESTYSFDYGRLHYVMLDCYRAGSGRVKDQAAMDEMIAWLEKDLVAAKARADWIIISYHEPTFNVGGHAETWGRDDLWPVLEKHGVDIVLCGHSHLYERIRPIGSPGVKPVIQITSGGGGGPAYNTYESPILDAKADGLHYCLWTIDGNRLEMVAKTPEGKQLDRLVLIKTDGRYQKEVMDRALLTADAPPLVKVLKIHRLSLDAWPRGGQAIAGTIPAGSLPPGYRVALAAATGCTWKVAPLEFTSDGGPVKLTLTPPAGVKLTATPWMGTFEPPLAIKLSLAKGDISYSGDNIEVLLPPEVLRQIVPTPAAATVPPAPESGLTIDGSFDDWAAVSALALAAGRGPSRMVRLAWNADGLYGAVDVKDKDVQVDAKKPWLGDCFALGLEMDQARRLSMRREDTKDTALFLYPADGKVGVLVQAGKFDRKHLTVAGSRTADGYRMEFRIAAEGLAPAKLAPGKTLGFNYVVHSGGEAVAEQFVDASQLVSTFGRPIFWGQLLFSRKEP
jgi:hypothetical protein